MTLFVTGRQKTLLTLLPCIVAVFGVRMPGAHVNAFIAKLWRMLSDRTYAPLIHWDQSGTAFLVSFAKRPGLSFVAFLSGPLICSGWTTASFR